MLNRNLIKHIFIFCVCIHPIKTFSVQINSNVQNIDSIIGYTYDNCADSELNYEELEGLMQDYYTDPLNLNESSIEELENLHILNELQVEALSDHIAKYGKLLSIYELQTLPHFDLNTIHRLSPFVYVEESFFDDRNNVFTPKGINAKNNYISTQYKRKLWKQADYKPTTKTGLPKYLGSPNETINKIRLRHPNVYDIGISAKKSAGEAFVWNNKTQLYGFNAYRGHLMIQNRGLLKKLILGSYDVGYGQGLVNNAGFSMSDGNETIKLIKTNNTGLRPQTSPKCIEFNGIATTLQWQLLNLTLYYSVVGLDQNIVGKTTKSAHIESGINRSCNYRTNTELERRNSLKEHVVGSTLLYNNQRRDYELGCSLLYTTFSLPFIQKKEDNVNKFSGNANTNGSLFYRYKVKNIHFFGESGFSKNLSTKTLQTKKPSPAIINGVIVSLFSVIDIALLHRYYSPAYNCFYGKPFSVKAKPCNEHGIYTGLRYTPIYQWYFDTSFDYARMVRSEKDQNPNIYQWKVRATYQPNKLVYTFLQYTEKRNSAEVTKAETESYRYTVKHTNAIMRKVKTQYKYTPNKSITLKSEVHINRYKKLRSNTWGYGLIQDLTYRLGQIKLTNRIGWIAPQSTKNAICTYEPGLLHAGYTFPRYTKRGILLCSIICYKPSRSWRLELKYSHMIILDKRKKTHNESNKKLDIENTISAQIIYSF